MIRAKSIFLASVLLAVGCGSNDDSSRLPVPADKSEKSPPRRVVPTSVPTAIPTAAPTVTLSSSDGLERVSYLFDEVPGFNLKVVNAPEAYVLSIVSVTKECEGVFSLKGDVLEVNSDLKVPTTCEASLVATSSGVQSDPLVARVQFQQKPLAFEVQDSARLKQHLWLGGEIAPVVIKSLSADGEFVFVEETCPGFFRLQGDSIEATAAVDATGNCSVGIALKDRRTGALSDIRKVEVKLYGTMTISSTEPLTALTIPGVYTTPIRLASDSNALPEEFSYRVTDSTCGSENAVTARNGRVRAYLATDFTSIDCSAKIEAVANGKVVSKNSLEFRVSLRGESPFRAWCYLNKPASDVAATLSAVRESIGRLSGSSDCQDAGAAANSVDSLDLSLAPGFDARVLYGLASLRDLNLAGVPGINFDLFRDLPKLKSLVLAEQGLKSVPDLSFLANLKSLDLGSNPISSLAGIEKLTGLKELKLGALGRLTDLSPLRNLAALESLSLDGNTGLTETQLNQLPSTIKSLNLAGTSVSDLSSLSRFASLEGLDITRTPVANLEPLRSLTSLRRVFLSGTRVQDVSPLAGAVDLSFLDVGNSFVDDLHPLASLANLRMVVLSKSRVTAAACPQYAASTPLSLACQSLGGQ